jgi:hypothetical protein
MNVTQSVPNYLGGISQQPDYDKSPGMLRDIKNAYPDITYGLQKRHGSRWEYNVGSDYELEGARWFTFRDKNDLSYFGAVIPKNGSRNASVRVWSSIDSTEKTVTGNFSYLEINDKLTDVNKDSYKTTSVNQLVIILNRNATVQPLSELTPGSLAGTVTSVAELPESASSGDIYYVTNGTTNLDDYYVEWQTGPNSSGAWIETVKPGISRGFSQSTMPHVLTQINDDTFSFSIVPYEKIKVGNEDTNQQPSFVNTRLENVFFYLNRVGFLSRNNVILSQPLVPEDIAFGLTAPNFFRVSTLTQSPADPIDVNTSSVRPVTLRSVQPTYQGLLLFSDGEQFTLFSESGVITPDTATIKSMSTYEYYGDVNAVQLGDNHYFLSRTLRHTRAFKMLPRGEALNPEVEEITKVITDYIPNDIDSLIPNTQNGFIALSSSTRNVMYIYRIFMENGEAVMKAWYTWELPGNIKGSIFIRDRMYAITSQNGEHVVSSITLNTIPEEDVLTNVDQQPGFSSQFQSIGPYLDFWVGEERLFITGKKFETGSDGRVVYNDMRVVLPGGYPTQIGDLVPCAVQTKDKLNRLSLNDIYKGAVFPVEVDGDDWIIKGNFYADEQPKFVVGYRYNYDLLLPTYFLMTEAGADYTAHLNISRYKFMFKDAAGVQYLVQSFGRNNLEDPDDWTNVRPQPDSQYYYSDVLPFPPEISLVLPVHQRNTHFNMRIYSDSPFPVTLNKLMWEGSYNPRYYRRV